VAQLSPTRRWDSVPFRGQEAPYTLNGKLPSAFPRVNAARDRRRPSGVVSNLRGDASVPRGMLIENARRDARIVKGDVAGAVAALKRSPGKDIVLWGSLRLAYATA